VLSESTALGSSLPSVVGGVRAGSHGVRALGVGNVNRLAGPPGSWIQAGLHLRFVPVVLLNPLIVWH
jgi:hypothetical protein